MRSSDYPEITDTKAWLREIDELITEADDIALDIEITTTISRQGMMKEREEARAKQREQELLQFLTTYCTLVDELVFAKKPAKPRQAGQRHQENTEELDHASRPVQSERELTNMQSLASRIREKTGAMDLNTLAREETQEDIIAEAESITLRRTLN